MAVTCTYEPLGQGFRHSVKTEKGSYVMGKSWIDATCPRDMMDYDFTQSMCDLHESHKNTHALWCALQVRP